MKTKLSRREVALLSHERRRVEKMMQGFHLKHRIVIKRRAETVVNTTIGELREAEVKRDGLGNCVKDCTFIDLFDLPKA